MAYGTIKVDNITFTNGGVDQTISVSGVVQSISGDITATGTIQGATIIGTSTVSGATVTGDAGQFTTATITSGVFASGIEAEPSVSVGTTDNGLYSPGTDQVALSTNGTGRLFIDANGNVGIGPTPNNYANYSTLTLNGTTGGIIDFEANGTICGELQALANEFRVNAVGASGVLRLYAGASERAAIDSSGRLLVGTSTSPGSGAGQYARLVVQGYTGAATEDGALSIQRGEAAANITSGENIGKISFNDSAGFAFADIAVQADANAGTNDYPGRLVFSTTADGASSPTERMRIGNDGNSGILAYGSTAFYISSNQAGATNRNLIVGAYGASSMFGGTISFIVRTNGNIENDNNSYGPISSDQRLKQDITDANSQWDDIKNIRITNFHYKSDPAGPLHLGPIAQELEQVSPGLITRRPASEDEIADPSNDLVDGDEVLSFKASILYMKAVKALQEAMERIETLEAKVAALESA